MALRAKRPELPWPSFEGSAVLRKGSYVVPFCVCHVFLVKDSNILPPKKELHRRVWVYSLVVSRAGGQAFSSGFGVRLTGLRLWQGL